MLSVEVARFRAAVLRELRAFFDRRGYLEVDPPVMAPSLIPEAHIEVFRTEIVSPYDDRASERFLTPSPEIWMKQLLAQGYGNIYYLGKAFRNAESVSRAHRHEFTMLEWYTVGSDYNGEADLTDELLREIGGRLPAAEGAATVSSGCVRMTVAEALNRYAGLPGDVFDRPGSLREATGRLSMVAGDRESDEDLYQRILVTHVEPRLPADRPVVLTDYPAFVPTLARTRGTTAERWELYLSGMEIANCYTEERDPRALRDFLEHESKRKLSSLVPHPPSEELLSFAAAPRCSGVALGVDRLIMALLQLRDIRGVIFFG